MSLIVSRSSTMVGDVSSRCGRWLAALVEQRGYGGSIGGTRCASGVFLLNEQEKSPNRSSCSRLIALHPPVGAVNLIISVSVSVRVWVWVWRWAAFNLGPRPA